MAGRFSKIIYELYGNVLDVEVNRYLTSNFELNKIIDLKYSGLSKIYANKDKLYFNVKYSFKDITQKDLLDNLIDLRCYVHCECQIDENITNFKIKREVCGEAQLRPNEDNCIEYTDDLIPIDRKYPMYNDVSMVFNDYDPNKTSIEGKKVNVYKLAELIGLKIYEDYEFDDATQSAMICFFDTSLSLFNTNTHSIENRKFEKGSIILNKKYIDERGSKSANFAVAHEIYHWLRHKYYVVLKHLSKGGVLYHTTLTRTQFFWRNEEERIEVQANKFAGTLLLQDRLIYSDFLYRIFNLNYLLDFEHKEDIVDKALNEFSDIYQVSKKTLAITLSSVSKKEQPLEELNKYKYDFKQQYDHYEIYENDFLNLFLTNDKFYKLINNRKLVYIKKKVVLNIPEAVKDGKITKLAKDNPDKYFINFTKTYSCFGTKLSTVFNNNSYKESTEFDEEKNKRVISAIREFELNDEAGKYEDKPFYKQLEIYRKRLKIKQEDLDNINISRQSISAYENDHEKPTLNNLVKLIIYYKLTPKEIEYLMKAGGYIFNNSKREKLLEYLVMYKKGASIEFINECLRKYEFEEI